MKNTKYIYQFVTHMQTHCKLSILKWSLLKIYLKYPLLSYIFVYFVVTICCKSLLVLPVVYTEGHPSADNISINSPLDSSTSTSATVEPEANSKTPLKDIIDPARYHAERDPLRLSFIQDSLKRTLKLVTDYADPNNTTDDPNTFVKYKTYTLYTLLHNELSWLAKTQEEFDDPYGEVNIRISLIKDILDNPNAELTNNDKLILRHMCTCLMILSYANASSLDGIQLLNILNGNVYNSVYAKLHAT